MQFTLFDNFDIIYRGKKCACGHLTRTKVYCCLVDLDLVVIYAYTSIKVLIRHEISYSIVPRGNKCTIDDFEDKYTEIFYK